MAATTNLNIRIDKDLKERADAVFSEMGMSLTTAFNIFVRQTLRQGKIPFDIFTDPFYSESNMRVLRSTVADMDAGCGIVRKSLEELEAMEDE